MTSLSALHLPLAPDEPRDFPPEGLVVLLHGWGANAEDLIELCPALRLEDVAFACPNGPMSHPYNPVGRMWYDLESPERTGLAQARSQLQDWLDELIAASGLPPEKIVLAGFSQGGAMTLEVGLGRTLGGLIVMSGYLHPELAEGGLPRPVSPILILHGQQDRVVPFQAALQTQAVLQDANAEVQLQPFPTMGHEISVEALAAMRKFIRSVLT